MKKLLLVSTALTVLFGGSALSVVRDFGTGGGLI